MPDVNDHRYKDTTTEFSNNMQKYVTKETLKTFKRNIQLFLRNHIFESGLIFWPHIVIMSVYMLYSCLML